MRPGPTLPKVAATAEKALTRSSPNPVIISELPINVDMYKKKKAVAVSSILWEIGDPFSFGKVTARG
jgi:hypothetical protein